MMASCRRVGRFDSVPRLSPHTRVEMRMARPAHTQRIYMDADVTLRSAHSRHARGV
jgi:hypothetical protein